MPLRNDKKKSKSWLLWTICIGIAAFLLWSIAVEPGLLVVREYNIGVPRWPRELNGLRVVLLSDLHVGSLHIDIGKVKQVVNSANAQNPDLILLLGDYVAGHNPDNCPVPPEKFAGELSHLKAKYGVFAILGNHDWWYNGSKVRKALETARIPVLENSATKIVISGQSLWLVGLADLWTRNPRIGDSLQQVPDNDPVIVLSHSPDVFPDIPRRVNLTLAGHTHGGQVSFPLIGPLIVPSEYGSRFAHGLIEEQGRRMFVCTGIGTSIFPIRFNIPPEISVLTLRSEDAH
jgi:predicted MPP superfamily phosphohydrolase